jgi:hypothetical protein
VLSRPVGGDETLRGQRRLIELANSPNIPIRVFPPSVGAHPGGEGPFRIIDLCPPGSSVVHFEHPNVAAYIDEVSEVNMQTLGLVAVEVLSQFGPWPAIAAVVNGVVLLSVVIRGFTRDVMTYRLARRALKKKKTRKALRDLAKVIEAQHGKRRGDRQRKDERSKSLLPGHPPVPPSGSSSP